MKKLNEIVWRHVKYKMCTNQLLICLFVVFLCHWNKFKVYARKNNNNNNNNIRIFVTSSSSTR